MYGLPPDCDWGVLRGHTVTEIRIGQNQCVIACEDLTIALECAFWVSTGLHSHFGSSDRPVTGAILLPLLGATIGSARAVDVKTLEIAFDSGQILRIRDDDDHYESFQIDGPGLQVIV